MASELLLRSMMHCLLYPTFLVVLDVKWCSFVLLLCLLETNITDIRRSYYEALHFLLLEKGLYYFVHGLISVAVFLHMSWNVFCCASACWVCRVFKILLVVGTLVYTWEGGIAVFCHYVQAHQTSRSYTTFIRNPKYRKPRLCMLHLFWKHRRRQTSYRTGHIQGS